MTLTHGELFAGISGFGLGFAQAGIETLWHVEIDEKCRAVLKRHYPGTLLLSDVRDCGAHNLPPVDVISFGSPCQDLSVAGKRKGLIDGEKSNLFFEAVRIVDELKPTFAVWENVPGAFSANSGRDFATVLAAFRDIGARDIAWTVLDAQYFALAQRRRRVFLVADFTGERAAEILFESSRSAWDSPPSRKAGQRAADPVTTSPYGDNEAQHRKLIASQELSPSLTCEGHDASEDGRGRKAFAVAYQCHGNNVGPMGTLREGNGGVTGGVPFVAFDRTRAATSGPIAGTLRACGAATPGVNDGKADAQCVAFQPRYARNGRGAPDTIVPPLTAEAGRTGKGDSALRVAFDWQSGGDVRLNISEHHTSALSSSQVPAVMRYGVRRLTPVEACRLQGFPDDWNAQGVDAQGDTIAMSDSARYRQLGNAVAVPCAQWLGCRILEAL